MFPGTKPIVKIKTATPPSFEYSRKGYEGNREVIKCVDPVALKTMTIFRSIKLLNESRRVSYRIILGTTAIVVLWAILHDQYLVRISPEHFTEYHKPLWDIQNPSLIAFLYGVSATAGPRLVLRIVYALFSRALLL